jgi:hypothetical protein
MRKRGFRGRTISEHAWLGARQSEKDKTREHSAETGRADSPVYVTLVGDARKLTRHGGEARNGPVCYMVRDGQPTTARERRGEVLQAGEVETDVAPKVQTPGPQRETVRLTATQRADKEVREASLYAMKRIRRMQLKRAGLLGAAD